MNQEKDLLLSLLNVDESKINYHLKNGNVSHTATGVVDLSFLLYMGLKTGTNDFQIVYNTSADNVSFFSYLNTNDNIQFDRYEVHNKDLHLFHKNIAYIIKDAGLYLFDTPTRLDMRLNENNSGLHTNTYRTQKYMTGVGPSLLYRLVYIGYPKIVGYVDDEADYDYVHSFDALEYNCEETYFLTDVQLDYDCVITSKFLNENNSQHLKEKLNIYKKTLGLITKGFKSNQYYHPQKSRIRFFINEIGQLDFHLNMQFTNKLADYSALEQVDKILKNRKHFDNQMFINFLASFENFFNDYFHKHNFDIDVTINSVDDLENYKNLMSMAKI